MGATTTTTEQAPALTKQTSPESEHEAVLTGVVALAQLFATCVEAFGLISPNHRWERQEQLLLCRLGLQQARLLIWGDVVGISSPPASVTDRAVPKHPSAAYPDLSEPTFFGPRDPRLDESARHEVERALAALVDRTSSASREEMMDQYGLRPPKKGGTEYTSPVDMNRLEAFRERYELLKEVAETYAHLNVRHNKSLMSSTSWQIADNARFDSYLKPTQEKIDSLIDLFGVKEKVDRALRMDIKALGWHLTADRGRVAQNVSKLRLIREHCESQYPEYVAATEVALQNIERERIESMASYQLPYTGVGYAGPIKPPKSTKSPRVSVSEGSDGPKQQQHKRPSLFGRLKSFGKKSRVHHHDDGRSKSSHATVTLSENATGRDEAGRALSDVGPLRSASEDHSNSGGGNGAALTHTRSKSVGGDPHDLSLFQAPTQDVGDEGDGVERFRSKSIGDIMEYQPEHGEDEAEVRARLERLVTGDGGAEAGGGGLRQSESLISRHDQYHGLGRQGTKGQ